MSAGDNFLKALFILPAQLVDPFSGALFQLGMVLVLPGADSGLQGLDLSQAHQHEVYHLWDLCAAANKKAALQVSPERGFSYTSASRC